MSASTRTAQRTLGTSQFGGMIVLLAVLAVIVAAIAFGTLGATKAEAPAAGAGANPVVDLVPRHEISAPKSVAGYWQPDRLGGLEFVPTPGKGDAANEVPSLGGWNHPPVPSTGDKGGIKGPGLDAR